MTEADTPFKGRRLDARFTLLEKLGSGGQGEVWRAHDETRGIDIALKVATSAAQGAGAVAAFEREHAIAARLNHPSVLKVFPPHRSGDVVLLPMELATGGDLRRLRGAGYLDIIPVLLDIAQALEHAHERGVIHRDLKPGNVLFDARGGVKLADFGAAGTTSTSAEDARLQGLSPFTASPEQLRGEAPTESDDIYGLGALAYELLSGYPPYYPHFDLRRAQEDPVPNLVPTRQIPPLLSTLVMRMLSKDRRERPHSMREVIDDLDAALNDTLTFDFESIVDPSHGALGAGVTMPGSEAQSAPNLTGARGEPVPGQEARNSMLPDDEDEYEQDEAPDLGLIPELLVANALVVTWKGNRTGSKPSADKPGESPGAVPGMAHGSHGATAGKPAEGVAQGAGARATAAAAANARLAADATAANNACPANALHRQLDAATPASAVRGAGVAPAISTAARSRADASQSAGVSQAVNAAMHTSEARTAGAPQAAITSNPASTRRTADNQAVANDTMLPPASTKKSLIDHGVRNDTMQLPASATRGLIDQGVSDETMRLPASAMKALIDQGVHNDTVQLPPDPGAGPRERIAAARRAKIGNETTLLPGAGARGAGGAGVAGPASAVKSSVTNSSPRSNTPRAEAPGTNTESLNALTAYAAATAGVGGANASTRRAAAGSTANMSNPLGASSAAAPTRQAPAQQMSTPQMHQPALATVGAGLAAAGGGGPNIAAERPLWESLQLETVPRVAKLEPIQRRRWPIVMLGILAGIAVAVFYWLPRYAPQGLPIDLSALSQQVSKSLAPAESSSTSPPDEATAATATTSGADNSAEAKLQATRENFDRRLAALDARAAGVWGGAEFAMAKQRAAESIGAHDAGNIQMAQDRLADASHLLDEVESRAPAAFAAQLAAGQKALAAGQEEIANEAFDLAKKIDPNDRRITDGQKRVHNLSGVLPLLADAQNAENARNYSRASQDYSQVLALDPGNDKARTGLARANASFGDDSYAKAVGSGFAALGAGRLDDARDAFEKARALRPSGSEAAEGLRRVGAALSAKGYASLRQRATGLEAQERWDEAVQLYDSALQADPSLAFAQEGKDRAAARAELAASMQALIDRPERMSSQSVRGQAKALLDTANAQSPSGPVLRSQITRLGMLLPDYDSSAWRGTNSARTDLLEKPVRLSLVSDNATAITIPSIGQFGTFAKREIELKPGRYTVIGTREGYRDVHRDITVSPGQESQTISVSCADIL